MKADLKNAATSIHSGECLIRFTVSIKAFIKYGHVISAMPV